MTWLTRLKSVRPAALSLYSVGLLAALTVLPFYPFMLPRPSPRDLPKLEPHPLAESERKRKLVIVILDGVGARVAYDPGSMPKLQARLNRSAVGIARAAFPTITPAGLRAILSGHRSVPEPEFPGTPARPEPDSLLRRAAAGGLKAFAVGQQNWPAIFGGHEAEMAIIRYRGAKAEDYDGEVFKAASDVVSGRRGPWNLLVVHFFACDPLGHLYGTENPVYRAQLRVSDEYLDRLAKLAGPGVSFIVTADHGQLKTGEHGGTAKDEIESMLVLWGAGVRPGKIGSVMLNDVASTAAALLGVEPPTMAEGLPVWSALLLTDERRERAWVDILQQRFARWKEARSDWPWLVGATPADLARVRRLAMAGDWRGAEKLARPFVARADWAYGEASPERWYGRYLVSGAVLAATCAAAVLWAGLMTASADLLVLGAFLAAVLLPLRWPQLWPLASLAALLAAAAALALTLRRVHGLPPRAWSDAAAVGLGVIGLGLPVFVDAPLWSLLALAAALIQRRRRGAEWRWPLLILGACVLIGPHQAPQSFSILRGLLPSAPPPARWLIAPFAGLLVTAAAAAVFARSLPGDWPRARRGLLTLAACAPLFLNVLVLHYFPVRFYYALGAVMFASFAALILAPAPRLARGLWIGLLALAFHRLFAVEGPGVHLTLALLLAWSFASKRGSLSIPWRALELVALGIWSYAQAGYTLDFAQISTGIEYKSFGASFHPYALVALVALKYLLAFLAPLSPLLAEMEFGPLLAALPLLGAMSAGNLACLWASRLWAGKTALAIESDEYSARALWVAIVAWAALAWWGACSVRPQDRRELKS